MLRGTRGNLRKVGDSHHLHVAGHTFHHATYGDADVAADAGVYLVEDDGRQKVVRSEHALDGQHQARELAARRHLGQVAHGAATVGVEEELHGIVTQRAVGSGRRQLDIEAGFGHAQFVEGGEQMLCQQLARLTAALGECLGGCLHGGIRFVDLLHKLLDAVVEGGDRLQTGIQLVAQGDELGNSFHSMLLLESID